MKIRSDETLQPYNLQDTLYEPLRFLNLIETGMIFCEALWQVGTASEDHHALRVAHLPFAQVSYATQLLKSVRKVLLLEDYGQNQNVLSLLIILVLRIISLNKEPTVLNEALPLIKSMRTIAYKWMQDTEQKLSEHVDGIGMKDAESLLRCAYLTRSTFDIDHEKLIAEDEDVEILIHCALTINQNRPVQLSNVSPDLKRLMLRDTRLAHELSRKIVHVAVERSGAISKGVGPFLAAYILKGFWSQSDRKGKSWIEMEIVHDSRICKLELHICSGTILIDNHQVDSLPEKYLNTPTYRFLFNDVSHES